MEDLFVVGRLRAESKALVADKERVGRERPVQGEVACLQGLVRDQQMDEQVVMVS